MLRKTHRARPVPPSYAKGDRLPTRTPTVGDTIVYTTRIGEPLHETTALARLREGYPVQYETYEEDGTTGPPPGHHFYERGLYDHDPADCPDCAKIPRPGHHYPEGA